jgi:hypothetical protein
VKSNYPPLTDSSDAIRHTEQKTLEEKTMTHQTEKHDIPRLDVPVASETATEKRIDRAAEESAEKAGKTEQRYDREHDIFTK